MTVSIETGIIGRSRVVDSAATVCACILLGGLVVLLCYVLPSDPVYSDLHVDAGLF